MPGFVVLSKWNSVLLAFTLTEGQHGKWRGADMKDRSSCLLTQARKREETRVKMGEGTAKGLR